MKRIQLLPTACTDLDEEKQLRFQLGYIHDRTTRQYGSEEIYYFAQDTVHTATNRHDRLKTDCLNGEVNYEDNAASRYTRENFSLQEHGNQEFRI